MEQVPPRRIVETLPFIGLLSLFLAGCGGGEELILPGDGQPAAIEVTGGDRQSGRVGEPLADPLVVHVTDARGRPVEGAPVAFEFAAAGPGADVIPQTTETDAAGNADARLVLGTTIGTQTGRARVVTDEEREPIVATFSARAFSESANGMAAVAGQDQTGHVGQPLDDLLVVEVTDEFGDPVEGVPIGFAVEGGGSVSAAMVETGEDGRARVERTLGPAVGQQATIATSEGVAGSPVTFVHTAIAGNASRLIIEAGDGQTGAAGSTLPITLVVRLVDADGNGVPRTALSWVVATGGGSAAPENTATDDEGRATTQWTLGEALGPQRLDAVVSGVGFVSFRATATAGAPASLFIVTQPSATARNGVPFDRQPVIQIRDARGNDVAIAGIAVRAGLASGGGELLGTLTRITDPTGRATFTDLAISGDAGTRTLSFNASDHAGTTSSEIDVAAPSVIPTTTTITGDSPDPSVAGSTFTVSFQVTSSGPTPTGSVTVSVSGGTPTCTGTLSGGAGSCQLTLNIVGDRTLTATYSGAPGLSGSSDTEPHVVAAVPPANEAPDADFNWHCEDLTCHFTDASEDEDGAITNRVWDFGDGTTVSNVLNPSHTYAAEGEYRVILTVTDNGGLTDQANDQVDPEAPPPPNQPPTVDFTWQCDDLDCDFESQTNDPDGDVEDWDWNFGDGDTSDDDDPSHEYDAEGTYSVTLTVTDNDGATASVQHSVPVNAPNQAPTADFTWICTNLDCQFTGQGNDPDGSISSWSWDFDDGSGSPLQNPQHTFPGPGEYDVTLTVTDNEGASRSVDHEVNVEAPPPPPPPNQAPTAVDDAYSTPGAGASLTVDAPGVLSNDSDPEVTPLSAQNPSDPAQGAVQLSNDGSFTYTPDAGASGSDSFTYQASDGSLTSTATVTITITP